MFKINPRLRFNSNIISLTIKENLEKENFTLIKDFIPKIFNEFLHNRVGTLLTKSEVELTNTFFKPKFTYQKKS